MPTFLNGQQIDDIRFNGDTVIEVTVNGNRVFVDAIEKVVQDPESVSQFRNNSTIMSEIASSSRAMISIASSRNALRSVANSRTATDEVYENGTAISALNSSPLKQRDRRVHDRCSGADQFFRNNRVILLSHNPSGGANSTSSPDNAKPRNQTSFGRGNTDFPQTANEVKQRTPTNNFRTGNRFSNIRFIDI